MIVPQQLRVRNYMTIELNGWKGCLALVALGGLLQCKYVLPCFSKLSILPTTLRKLTVVATDFRQHCWQYTATKIIKHWQVH
jgi:hypothetical protein